MKGRMGAGSSSLPGSFLILLFITAWNVCTSVSDVISYFCHGNTTKSPLHMVSTFNLCHFIRVTQCVRVRVRMQVVVRPITTFGSGDEGGKAMQETVREFLILQSHLFKSCLKAPRPIHSQHNQKIK